MNNITINSHDFLGKLSIIKNQLFLALESLSASPTQSNPADKVVDRLKKAYQANEEVIKMIKESSLGKPPKSLR